MSRATRESPQPTTRSIDRGGAFPSKGALSLPRASRRRSHGDAPLTTGAVRALSGTAGVSGGAGWLQTVRQRKRGAPGQKRAMPRPSEGRRPQAAAGGTTRSTAQAKRRPLGRRRRFRTYRSSWGSGDSTISRKKNFPREGREEETSEAEIDMEVSIAVVVGL